MGVAGESLLKLGIFRLMTDCDVCKESDYKPAIYIPIACHVAQYFVSFKVSSLCILHIQNAYSIFSI